VLMYSSIRAEPVLSRVEGFVDGFCERLTEAVTGKIDVRY
jgi:hypothetical protein